MPEVKFVDLGRQYLRFRDEILEAFDAVSRRGDYVSGKEVAAFEESFAGYCGTPHAVAVGNGSDALFLSLACLGIGDGDEVITAPNSFVATAWAIARTGARIVFADVGPDMNLDPGQVQQAVTGNTRAIVPVHLTGRVTDMDPILAVAGPRGVFVVEDAAQAVGAEYRGRRAGSFGDCGAFSLHPLKNLHVHGDGGVITLRDPELAGRLRRYRNHGLQDRDTCAFWGVNSRLDTVQAAIAAVKLRHLDAINERMREIAGIYTDRLADVVQVPVERDHERPVYHRYMIQHPRRDRLMGYLAEAGIETKVNYPVPLHLQPAAADLGYAGGDFPAAERLAERILSLPLYPELRDAEIRHVVETVRRFCRDHGDCPSG